MKKIVSNVLIVSTQLIIGGLFLFMLFSDSNDDMKNVVVENDNLNKMADAVSELFVANQMANTAVEVDESIEVDLITEQEKKAREEEIARQEAEKARILAEEEAARKALEEAEAKAREEAAKKNAIIVNANGYVSKPASGFNVTTGNRTYSLTNDEFNVVAGVVACEAVSKDDALAVMSVILNRADSRGMTPLGVVAQGNGSQFSCYLKQGNPSRFASVVTDALNGIRNTTYTSFNGWYSSVSDNYIVNGGNRFY